MLTKIIGQAQVETFAHWMEEAEQYVIVAHISPDGDAVGSSL
ncbi:MAG: bifunctional oligoribonuclease/PAP phosphatase NrnA, partial [Bacteroides sp.]